jgi:hypothetical protein
VSPNFPGSWDPANRARHPSKIWQNPPNRARHPLETAPQDGQNDPEMAQDTPKVSARWPKLTPRCPREDPKTPQDSPKMAKMSTRCPKIPPRGPQYCPKTAQDGPRWPQYSPSWQQLLIRWSCDLLGHTTHTTVEFATAAFQKIRDIVRAAQPACSLPLRNKPPLQTKCLSTSSRLPRGNGPPLGLVGLVTRVSLYLGYQEEAKGVVVAGPVRHRDLWFQAVVEPGIGIHH